MFFETGNKTECFGCEACVQVCAKRAITMKEDEEGFRYPVIDQTLCVDCGMCRNVCPHKNMPRTYEEDKYAFGGYHKDKKVRFESTSGGAFTAIVDTFCDENYVIFGAQAKGLRVFHSFVEDKKKLGRHRKSKYLQSEMGSAFRDAKEFLKQGKKVLFSGTPCQIAGLVNYLGKVDTTNLLTVEVICEGVPSPHYVRKYEQAVASKSGEAIEELDYRYTGNGIFSKGKWDFQQMKTVVSNGDEKKTYIKDRWFNPFWSVWLKHLMSRPSCYECPFATTKRVADLSLGDLWGVHLYCPELYGSNGGSSLIVANTKKGRYIAKQVKKDMYGHRLHFEDALKYQSPMRKHIDGNENRDAFMKDLMSDMSYQALNKKWADKPDLKLLWQKYVWGNRQKIFVWKMKRKIFRKKKRN